MGDDVWDRVMRPFNPDQEEHEGKEEEKENDDEAQEGLRVRVVRKGYDPTQKEIDDHMATHLPFRSWCAHCVKGSAAGLHRGKNEQDKADDSG